jgi:hypothetical protein
MNLRALSLGILLTTGLAAPLSLAPAAHADAPQTAPTRGSLQQALERAVTRHVAKAGLSSALGGYSLAPSVVQLRRYADPGKGQTKVVCVVSLAIKGERDELLGEVRGSAAALGSSASAMDALDAAAESAVGRMPEALSKLQTQAGERDRVARR